MPELERAAARISLAGSGTSNVSTGVTVLDYLVGLLARYAGFELALEVEPGEMEGEVAAAGRALGEAVAEPLRAAGARGHGFASVPAEEALAHVALEVARRPLVVSNFDLTQAKVGGLGSDLVAGFLNEFAAGASLSVHVRLIEGSDTQHVLDAIFKALGAALAEACRPIRKD